MEPQQSTGNVLSLLGQLYDASTDVNKWEPFLESISKMFNAFGANLNYYDVHAQLLSFTSFTGLEQGEKYTPLFIKHAFNDPRYPKNVNKAYLPEPDPEWMKGKPWTDRMAVSEKELHKSSMYQEVLKPQNIEYTIVSFLINDPSNMVTFGLFRGPDDEPWTEQDCDLLNQIVPHIQRAVTIHKRLSQLDFERRAALNSLDQINMGLILVDETQHILFANKQARMILDGRDGMSDLNTKLEISNSSLNQILNNMIAEVIENSKQSESTNGKCLSLLRPSGKRDYSLLVSPIWGNIMQVQNNNLNNPIAAIFISDPESTPGVQVDLLKQLYGLTKTEARILDKLVRGNNVKTLASQMRVQENTIRQHLKKIYAKTETDSQATLIQKIMSSPIWLGAHMFSKH